MLLDKANASRVPQRTLSLGRIFFFTAIGLGLCTHSAHAITLARAETGRIARKVWKNECNGTVAGLTSWNAGENFASLGIGHFIWYPNAARGPFEESFPKLVDYIASHGKNVPAFARGLCPWNSRSEFERAAQTPQMKELRQFLVATIDEQAQFLVLRLDQSLQKMLAAAPANGHANVERQFHRVASAGDRGSYALVDYVNFKGEGVLETERYRGQGWGLLQALQEMSASENGDAVRDFAAAARKVLSRRAKNSPPERNESRWLSGWLARINTYLRD